MAKISCLALVEASSGGGEIATHGGGVTTLCRAASTRVGGAAMDVGAASTARGERATAKNEDVRMLRFWRSLFTRSLERISCKNWWVRRFISLAIRTGFILTDRIFYAAKPSQHVVLATHKGNILEYISCDQILAYVINLKTLY